MPGGWELVTRLYRQPNGAPAGGSTAAGRQAAARAVPWVASLLVHLAVAVALSFTGIVIARGSTEQEIIIADARLSDTPGGRMLDGSADQPPAPLAGQVSRGGKISQSTDSDPAAARGIIGASAGAAGSDEDGTGTAQLVGLGSGAPMSLGSIGAAAPEPPAGPVTKFFGTGGNAHHVVYLVDWSGSMYAEGRYQSVQLELLRSLGELQSSQDFHIMFFSQGAPMEAPPAHLVTADDEHRAAAGRFMRDNLGQPGSSAQADTVGTDPVPAIRRAFEVLRHPTTSKRGKIIYLLTDGDFANNQAVMAELARLNRNREVHINTILYATSLELSCGSTAQQMLSDIAAAHGGTFRWVKVDE